MCEGVLDVQKSLIFVGDDDKNRGDWLGCFDGKGGGYGGKKDPKKQIKLGIVSEIKENLKEDY